VVATVLVDGAPAIVDRVLAGGQVVVGILGPAAAWAAVRILDEAGRLDAGHDLLAQVTAKVLRSSGHAHHLCDLSLLARLPRSPRDLHHPARAAENPKNRMRPAQMESMPAAQAGARRFVHEADLDAIATARAVAASRREGRRQRRKLLEVQPMKVRTR